MGYQKSRDLVDELTVHKMPVFDISDAARIYRKPKHYVSKVLSQQKKISRIERGKYFLIGASEYDIASNIVYPSYVSLFAAFKYYGLTEQEPAVFSVISIKRHASVRFANGIIEFIAIKRDRFFGYTKENNAFIAEPEKAIVDAMYLNKPAYSYISDAIHSGIRSGLLDINKLKEYALRMKSASMANKLGFLLDKERVKCDDLIKYMSTNYVHISEKGKITSKWRIVS